MTLLRSALVCGLVLGLMSGGTSQAQSPPPKPLPKPLSKPDVPPKPETVPLIIETDLACTVYLDGDEVGTLPANGTVKVQVMPGDHVVRAVSTANPSIVFRKTVPATARQSSAVAIELAPLMTPAKPVEDRSLPALLIKADLDARISVNGGKPEVVKAGDSVRIAIALGQNLVEAVTTAGDVRWSTTIDVTKPIQAVVDTDLRGVQERMRAFAPFVGAWTMSTTGPRSWSENRCSTTEVIERTITFDASSASALIGSYRKVANWNVTGAVDGEPCTSRGLRRGSNDSKRKLTVIWDSARRVLTGTTELLSCAGDGCAEERASPFVLELTAGSMTLTYPDGQKSVFRRR